jgi:hypothetical protein
MEGWQQDWIKTLETVSSEIEQFFQDIGREINEFAEAMTGLSEDMAEDVEHAIAPGLNQLDEQIAEWFDPILQAILGFEATFDQAVEPVTHTVEPWLNQHPVCIGCQHYHGRVYGDNLLVCAMHPYGVSQDDESCPDKEPTSWSLSQGVQGWMLNSADDDDF